MDQQTTTPPPLPPPPREFRPGAAILAWVWPGLGHFVIGEKKRGQLIMFGVLFLFFTGLLIGGIDAVDRREDRLWFFAQSLCGPIAFAADYVNQRHLKPPLDIEIRRLELEETLESDLASEVEQDAAERELARLDDVERRYLDVQGLGRVNDLGTLFIALAGLMNLVVILDALHFAPKLGSEPRAPRRRASD